MMIQMIGALLTVLTSTIAGIYWGVQTVYRIEELQELKRAMIMLQNQISFLTKPLPEALEDIGKKTDSVISHLFCSVAKEMEQRQGQSGEEIWRQSVLQWQNTTYLEKEDIDAMLCFGNSLGYLDIIQQKASIALFLEYIETTVENLQEKSKKQMKLYPSMGILTGLLLVVVLL
ncbi:MAG TPA: stage III sporulation protein AB [Candidatus Coprocola pullicola]|nr:stage III sporulation protein AB [Candidatus Coprocola pullicola]